ncbi:MAG: hypothetical protein ACE149_17190 [Armatimonadota bacterium]
MTASFRITSPWHGDVLNLHDGSETPEQLTIEVTGVAPEGSSVAVNGVGAEVRGGVFRAPVAIRGRSSKIEAVCRTGSGELTDAVTVLWDRGSPPRYRFSVDDNIEFLKDLGTRPDDYRSLFDHWYLAFWRRMHEEYDAKIHINIYYQTVGGGFTIAQMPAKWRDEWEANAGWLHLSFHALQDQPELPYQQAGYDQMARDFELVMGEIRRFAGEAVTSAATTVHWAAATKEGCRALYDRGIRVLIGIFRREFGGKCPTGYYLSDEMKDHADERDACYDPETDLLFVTEDSTVNSLAVEEIAPWLDRQAANPHTRQLMELLIHEQYFRKELSHYQPDIQEKVVRCLRWVTDHGYAPVFWGDGFLGNESAL